MKSYYSLRIVAIIHQIIAWFILVVTILGIIILWDSWVNEPDGIFYVLGVSFLAIIYFIVFTAASQSIMLMVNMANDVYVASNNLYVISRHTENQRLHYEKQNLENQQKIIVLLSSLQQGGNIKPNPHINPDDI